MSLRFLGDWNPWLGAGLALALGAFAWVLYRRETRQHASRLAWVLPLTRTLVVLMAVLMLTGPVLHHRKVIGERGRVLIFVDGSASMGLTDDSMEPARKLLALERLGWLPANSVDTTLSRAADSLARARRSTETVGGKDAARRLADGVKETADLLARVKADTGGVAPVKEGVALREVWMNLPGADVADLTRSPDFPGKPSQVTFQPSFEAPERVGDNYGTRLTAFLVPPDTGSYTFWIAGDDRCELWLTGDAGTRALVARVSSFTLPRAWDSAPEQKSAPVRLTKGQKYLLEALHKQATGPDHVAVGWQLPDGKMERPIPGTRLQAPVAGETPQKSLESMAARFREELVVPAQALASGKRDKDSALPSLVTVASRWERELHQAFANHAGRVAQSPGPAVREALGRFDALPRWKRVEAMLASGPNCLLDELAKKHHVEVLSLASREATPVWSSGRDDSGQEKAAPRQLRLDSQARSTDLSDGIRTRVGDRDEERVAAVLFSDGQHNEGSSPLQTAKILGSRQIPVHTVSVGSTVLPDDLAILKVKTPTSVFFKDRVKGEILLKDDMPPGRPFTAKIECSGVKVWENKFSTEQSHHRTIPFDFPLQALVEKVLAQREKGVEILNQPLTFLASVSPVEGEKEKSNNDADFTLHAIMQRRKVLILDGRPRWETRYLRNLFERDEQWELNTLLADKGGDATAWARGPGAGKFPPDRESLYAYDFIAFGEVPRQYLKMEELEWIRDFVAKRGGGLLVIDGRRGHVSSYAETPIGALLPVDWKGETGRPTGLRLTEKGARFAPLLLAGEADRSQEIWASLAAPHWIAPARALPGSETLLEGVIGERRVPALVSRRYGAGKVLYAGFDESWRWRYEVADLHHQRYWNQLVREVMEPPFAVRDSRVALDAGKPVYATGESASIRARLRDAEGKPLAQAEAEAWITRDGRKVASIQLAPDENMGGAFHGSTAPLTPGRYEVRLHAAGLPDGGSKVKTEFVVRASETGELAVLNANEELMRQIATQSGGDFYREEEIGDLAQRLEPLSREKVLEGDTALWQSWWWFLPIVGLLSLEWVLRKWAGML
jgi:hypothetical protein